MSERMDKEAATGLIAFLGGFVPQAVNTYVGSEYLKDPQHPQNVAARTQRASEAARLLADNRRASI